ncbi:MAG: NAD(P)/FAD-dependent oxidoreductase [Pseudooceanicola sp.]
MNMTQGETYDIAVVGAGIAGASAAAELARFARVILIESEPQPGYHSTGRSAAILAQTYGSSVIRALTRASANHFEHPPQGFSQNPLLSPRGLIRIGTGDQIDGLRAMFDELRDTKFLTWLSGEAVQAKLPLLRPGYAAGGFFNPSAQDIDVHALLTGYLRVFRQAGGTILTNATVSALRRVGSGWAITAGSNKITAGIVVNAAGAWGDKVAAMAGATPMALDPRRRTAITFDAPQGFDPSTLPMIVDAEESFYLKPEGGRLMASPADETESEPCDSRPDEMDIAVCVDRITTAFNIDVRRIHSSWSGLRTFVRDRAPICGFDPDIDGFFWLAAQGGYGVQTAPAMARLTASMIRGETPDDEIVASGLSVGDIAPGRQFLAV